MAFYNLTTQKLWITYNWLAKRNFDVLWEPHISKKLILKLIFLKTQEKQPHM